MSPKKSKKARATHAAAAGETAATEAAGETATTPAGAAGEAAGAPPASAPVPPLATAKPPADKARPGLLPGPKPAKKPWTWPVLPLLGASNGWAPKAGPTPRSTMWLVLAAIAVAWVFGFALRAAWLGNLEGAPGTMYEDARLLTTADAYFYASGVLAESTGFPADNPRVPMADDSVLVAIGAAAVQLFGVAPIDVANWLSAFIAPLVAIPLLLFGLMFGQAFWGFIAALVSVLGFSYWNRTVPGYFDTDMITIPYVFGVVILIVAAFWRRRPLFGAIAAALMTIAPYMHPGSERVLAAVTLASFGYGIVFAHREASTYKIVLALLVSFLPLPFWARVLIIGALEVGLRYVRIPHWPLLVTTVLMLVFVCWQSHAMDLVLNAIGIRLRRGYGNVGRDLGLRFPGIGETVAELSNPGFDKLGARVAGGTALMFSGAIGFLFACWRHRPLTIMLPLIMLGTVLAAGGQRYSIFAVPIAALGNAYLFMLVGGLVAKLVPSRQRLASIGTAILLSPLAIVPAIDHAISYPGRTAVTTFEAQQLAQLSKQVKPGDYVVTWWDYSYGLWYYSGARTIVDGTKQNEDLWFASEALFSPSQREVASLMRLMAEEQAKGRPLDAVIDDVVEQWLDTSKQPLAEFIPALRAGQVKLPEPTRQVFFYLPWRIIHIAPNIAKLRPAKGLVPDAEIQSDAFLVPIQLKPDGTPAQRTGWTFDAKDNVLVSPRRERIKVHRIADVTTDANGRVRANERVVHPDGKLEVINLRHSNMVLYTDRMVYDSTLSQLLFLVKPDPHLFQPVSFSRGGVIYKLML